MLMHALIPKNLCKEGLHEISILKSTAKAMKYVKFSINIPKKNYLCKYVNILGIL